LAAATLAVGRYAKATLELDYTHANIQVERADGRAVQIDFPDTGTDKEP
jgi:hypothetical protein